MAHRGPILFILTNRIEQFDHRLKVVGRLI